MKRGEIWTVAGGSDYAGKTYVIDVIHSDGTTEQVASWKALPGKVARVTGSTATKTSEITAVEVRDARGTTVLKLAQPS